MLHPGSLTFDLEIDSDIKAKLINKVVERRSVKQQPSSQSLNPHKPSLKPKVSVVDATATSYVEKSQMTSDAKLDSGFGVSTDRDAFPSRRQTRKRKSGRIRLKWANQNVNTTVTTLIPMDTMILSVLLTVPLPILLLDVVLNAQCQLGIFFHFFYTFYLSTFICLVGHTETYSDTYPRTQIYSATYDILFISEFFFIQCVARNY